MLQKSLAQMASLIYPATCIACESSLSRPPKRVEDAFRNDWCDDCWVQLPDSWNPGCPKCGAFIKRPEPFADRCALCSDLPLRFDSAVSLGNYEGLLKRLVLALKRDMSESLAYQLGRLLGIRLMQQDFFSSANMIVPVPIHWARRFKRGFHAAAVIAEGIHAVTDIPVSNRMLGCNRLTQKQGTLRGKKRFANIKEAFRVSPLVSVEGLRIVVVDDVMTSGATLSELGRLLRKSGAASVHCGVLARGTGNYRFDDGMPPRS